MRSVVSVCPSVSTLSLKLTNFDFFARVLVMTMIRQELKVKVEVKGQSKNVSIEASCEY